MKRRKKDPNAPKRPLTTYMAFVSHHQKIVAPQYEKQRTFFNTSVTCGETPPRRTRRNSLPKPTQTANATPGKWRTTNHHQESQSQARADSRSYPSQGSQSVPYLHMLSSSKKDAQSSPETTKAPARALSKKAKRSLRL